MRKCESKSAGHAPLPEIQNTSRRVVTAFEAWDYSLGMVVIMNSGSTLRPLRILADHDLSPDTPALRRAVEFEFAGARYLADYDRIWRNTRPPDTPRITGQNP
jgi:hypothetical protein